VLLVSPSGPMSISPHVRKLPYDAVKDFTPVGMLARVPAGLAVPANSPVQSLSDLVKAGRESTRGLNFGVGLAGGHMHLMGELIAGKTGIKILAIPYRGNSLAAAAAASGDVDFTISDLTSLMPLVKANRLRLLAVTDTRRAPMLPDVPTIEESGFPNAAADAWIGIFAPAGMPPEFTDKVSAEIAKVLALPAVQGLWSTIGLAPLAMTSSEMKRFLASDIDRWGRVIKESGVKLE
jgi:tripartite-type tricarboxylate transporter receptor subunit TctC